MSQQILMFAYGMNTNLDAMFQRCPDAEAVGVAELQEHELEFVYHCNVKPAAGRSVPGLLWTITDQDLKALDWAEGYPTYYDRAKRRVVIDGHELMAVVYFMTGTTSPRPPSSEYLHIVQQGYAQNQINPAELHKALNTSYELQTT